MGLGDYKQEGTHVIEEGEGGVVWEGIRTEEEERSSSKSRQTDFPEARVGLGSKRASIWRIRVATKTTIRVRTAFGSESEARKLEPSRLWWFDNLVIVGPDQLYLSELDN